MKRQSNLAKFVQTTAAVLLLSSSIVSSLPLRAQSPYPYGVFNLSYDGFWKNRGCEPKIMKTIACRLRTATTDGLEYQNFARVVLASNLRDNLSEPSDDVEFTVFVPLDSAFSRAMRDSLLENKDELNRFVKSHIIRGKITEEDFRDGEVRTLAGTTVRLESRSVNEATIIGEDATARTLDAFNPGNGILITIDRALVNPNP